MKRTIETKFDVGQKVWMLVDSKAVERVVRRVNLFITKKEERVEYNMEVTEKYFSDEYTFYDESKVFATKEELRKAVFGD
mgnify:CR=1 FL=1|jgi:hypothetical protein